MKALTVAVMIVVLGTSLVASEAQTKGPSPTPKDHKKFTPVVREMCGRLQMGLFLQEQKSGNYVSRVTTSVDDTVILYKDTEGSGANKKLTLWALSVTGWQPLTVTSTNIERARDLFFSTLLIYAGGRDILPLYDQCQDRFLEKLKKWGQKTK